MNSTQTRQSGSRAKASTDGRSRRPADMRIWLLGALAAATVTFVLQFVALAWGPWSPTAPAEATRNLPAMLVYVNPIGITLTAWLIARFGPAWARSGIFDRRWNYTGFFLATVMVYLFVLSVAAGIFQMVTTTPFDPGFFLFGFVLVILFTTFGGLPLWAFISALAIGPRGSEMET